MTTGLDSISTYSRYNLHEDLSDTQVFIKEYQERVLYQLQWLDETYRSPFKSFADKKTATKELKWLQDNNKTFLENTENVLSAKQDYMAECGFIFCIRYSPDGEYVMVGHSSGLIQEYAKTLFTSYEDDNNPKLWYPMFYTGKFAKRDEYAWVRKNYDMYLKGGPNEIMYNRWFFSELGFITALKFAPNGAHIILAYSSGLMQLRHGFTGTVMCTLRNIQFPPRPIYALEYSKLEENVCFAACMDGNVYRVEIPEVSSSQEEPPQYCIRSDPALECLNLQFFGAPGKLKYATPFVSQRAPALSLGQTSDQCKMIVGYGDNSIKVYDMATQETDITYKVHKLRLQFIPKKLQRMHAGQVCALKCHQQRPFMFASAGWDKTLRIWDTRCKVGCVITFEGVDICSDSIDINRDQVLTGSWKPTEAITIWDLTARKRLCIVRVQNRRPDVDGEYIYACKYWRSTKYNRKGKYAIIGGSGTECVEIINLHNRYISCSYPALGTVLAIASHEERIAFGGTATTFNIVKFHDPKHEKEMYYKEEESDFDYTKAVNINDDSDMDKVSGPSTVMSHRTLK